MLTVRLSWSCKALVLVSLMCLVHAARSPAGPQSVTRNAKQEEEWKWAEDDGSGEVVYSVRDYGALRPTVVYNCHNVPALCNNARQYLGAATTATFHYDASGSRGKERREQSCGGGWASDHPCPERNQPGIFHYLSNGIGGEMEVFIYEGPPTGKPSDGKQLATKTEKRMSDNSIKTTYTKILVKLTCDEFPAASWIQGGNRDGRTAATYCTPMGVKCQRSKGTTYNTEQDWQASAFGSLRAWFARMAWEDGHQLYLEGTETQTEWERLNFAIFTFDFRMETVATGAQKGWAVYVEAKGTPRYCYGPGGTGGLCAGNSYNKEKDGSPTNPSPPAATSTASAASRRR